MGQAATMQRLEPVQFQFEHALIDMAKGGTGRFRFGTATNPRAADQVDEPMRQAGQGMGSREQRYDEPRFTIPVTWHRGLRLRDAWQREFGFHEDLPGAC